MTLINLLCCGRNLLTLYGLAVGPMILGQDCLFRYEHWQWKLMLDINAC
jgi:hypothetical protein